MSSGSVLDFFVHGLMSMFAGVLLLSAFSLQAFSSQAELQNTIVLNEVWYREV
jgi:hypothetical protein